MKFLYKIHSGYDGFRPSVIPQRMDDGRLRLGWRNYIDVVEQGWECWIYFHGPHRFENGVYAKGIVDEIDLDADEVTLRVRSFRTTKPLTSRSVSARVAEIVATRYRQVFLWPDNWVIAPECGLTACRNRECDDCETWDSLPLIEVGHARSPSRMRQSVYEAVVPAHWIVPRRCYEGSIVAKVRELTRRFTDFKIGEMAYAYPFARSMFEQLRLRGLLQFDYIVPIPLSPDKIEKGEKHRTLMLSKELGRLLAVRTREMLQLTESISKRRMKSHGYTTAQFERKYLSTLTASVPRSAARILLVDDVLTRGSTVSQALRAIRRERPETRIVVATAGQMIVKDTVIDDRGFKA